MTRTNDLAAAKACLTGLCGAEAPVLAAVSGGLDSMCLLHLLATWGRERNLNVAAAHFNHQLRGAESDRDERFVRDWCYLWRRRRGKPGTPFSTSRKRRWDAAAC